MEKRKRLPTYITGTGTAIYPWLVEADTRFVPEGTYHVKLRLPADSTVVVDGKPTPLVDLLESEAEASVRAAKDDAKNPKKVKRADLPYSKHEDSDGNETGDYVFNFKLKAKVTTKKGDSWEQKPKLYDSNGQPARPKSIFGGSELKVAFSIVPWYTPLVGAGISLRLRAVQIVTLVEAGGGDDVAFGKVDNGYVAEANPFGESSDATDEEQDF